MNAAQTTQIPYPDPAYSGPAPLSHPRWEEIKPGLRAKIPDPFYRTFIQPLIATAGESPEDRELSLLVPDEKLLEHIKLRYIKIIEDSLRDVDYSGRVNLLPQKSKLAAVPEPEQLPTPDASPSSPEPGTPRYQATATATPIAGPDRNGFIHPEQDHNQLQNLFKLSFPGGLALVTGANGYGKTTLARDIAGRFAAGERPARYLSLETFLTEFSLACREKTALAWRAEIRRNQVLIIDDFQFVKKGAGHSQEEIRNLIDEFDHQGRKLVLCSDRPFHELPLSDTLRSRFFSGFRVELPPPDYSTRLEILRRETAALGCLAPREDLMFLARNIAGDARKLRSAAQRLHYSPGETSRKPLDPARLEELCRDLFTYRLEIAPETIVKVIAEHYRTTPEAVAGPSRDKKNALARHLVACLCIDLAGLKFGQAARLIGRKDHSCVVHARKKIAAMLEEDLFFRQEVETLKSRILRQSRQSL